MREKRIPNFMIGLLLGALIGLLIWYWQKSTSAENGALALLDRLAAAESKVRELQAQLVNAGRQALSQPAAEIVKAPPAEIVKAPVAAIAAPDDLQQVRGIGPIFAGRLHSAGIDTFAALAATGAEELAQVLGVSMSRAENILAEARTVIGD